MKRISLILLFYSSSLSAWAQNSRNLSAFTPGNIVVYRIGDGVSLIEGPSITLPVFLDEYTPNGTLIQSIPLPITTNGVNKPLVSFRNHTREGLSLSANGQYLVLTGFACAPGLNANTVMTSDASVINRVIGLVDYNGNVNTTTALSDFATQTNAVAAASTNGIDLWAVGGGGGVRFTTIGSTTSTQLNNATPLFFNDVKIADGQLYVSTNFNLSAKIGKMGTGLPITAGQTFSGLPNVFTNLSPRQFATADLDPGIAGPDVLYVADQGTSSPLGGILKFSLVAGAWTFNGSVGSFANQYQGLAITVSGSTVTLFASRSGSVGNRGEELVKVIDASGYNGSFSATPAVIVSVTNSHTKEFRGIAMAPIAPAPCTAPTLSATNISASSASINWSSVSGTGYEFAITMNSQPPVSGTFTSNNSFNATGLSVATVYYFHIRTKCTNNFSSWASTSFATVCPVPLAASIVVNGFNATVNWNQFNGINTYQYAITNSATPPASGSLINTTSLSLTNLNGATSYYAHVRSDCGGGVFSNWVTTPFKTGCPAPQPRLLFNVKAGYASITWNKMNGAIAYEYAVLRRPSPPAVGNHAVTKDSLINYSDLKAGIKYYFYIRSQCRDQSLSDWRMIEFNPGGIEISPNPIRKQATIRVFGNFVDGLLTISGMDGRVFRKLRLTGNTISIDMSDLPAGVYLVKYENVEGYVTKFIKL